MKLAPKMVSGRVVNTSMLFAWLRASGTSSNKQAQALGLADPVALHHAHLLGPALERIERLEQVLGEVGDFQEPLRQLALLDHRAGAPAAAVDHLLVGEHGHVDRVPVDLGALAVDEAGLEEIEEQLLLVP